MEFLRMDHAARVPPRTWASASGRCFAAMHARPMSCKVPQQACASRPMQVALAPRALQVSAFSKLDGPGT